MEINDSSVAEIRKILKNFESEFLNNNGRLPKKSEIDSRIAKYYKIYYKYKEAERIKVTNENTLSSHWTPNLSSTWNLSLNKKPNDESTEVTLESNVGSNQKKEKIKFSQDGLMAKLRNLKQNDYSDSTDKRLKYSLKYRQSQYLQQLQQFKEKWAQQNIENETNENNESSIASESIFKDGDEGQLSWVDYMYRYSNNVVPSSKLANITNTPTLNSRKRLGDENYLRLNMKRRKFGTSKRKFGRNKKYRCFNCGVPGHFAQQCPDREVEPLGPCHRCGESTHQTEQCDVQLDQDFVPEESFEIVMPPLQWDSTEDLLEMVPPSDEEDVNELTLEDQIPNDVRSLFLSLMGDGDDFSYALTSSTQDENNI